PWFFPLSLHDALPIWVYFSGVPHHNIDAYRKSDFREAVEVVFAKEVEIAKSNRLRAFSDLQRTAFSLYALSIGHAHLKYVGRSEDRKSTRLNSSYVKI